MSPGSATNPGNSKFWIIGGGKFGLISARAVQRANPSADIVVVDMNPEVCRRLASMSFTTVCMDGVVFINETLGKTAAPDWIIPVIPIHLVFEWIKVRLAPKQRVATFPVPSGVVDQVPNPMVGPGHALYLSIADFQCPENCPEPPGKCTYTGKYRPYLLFDKLGQLQFEDYRSIVVRSHQLSPGVGGFKPAAMSDALDAVESSTGPVLLSTACSCHGVMNAFKYEAINS